jgi:hypothetical protein
MSALIRLYPRAWRDRYETEFRELLEARRPGVRDRIDIVSGAIDARLHPEVPGQVPGGVPHRRVPVATITSMVGGVAFLGWIGLILRDFRGWGTGQPGSEALLLVLSAISTIALVAAHAAIVFAGAGTIRPIGVLGGSIAAVTFGLSVLGAGSLTVIALLASALLAIGSSGRVIPAWLGVGWVLSVAAMIVGMTAFVAGGGQDVGLLQLVVPYGLTWVLVGVVTARRGFPAPGAPADTIVDAPGPPVP